MASLAARLVEGVGEAITGRHYALLDWPSYPNAGDSNRYRGNRSLSYGMHSDQSLFTPPFDRLFNRNTRRRMATANARYSPVYRTIDGSGVLEASRLRRNVCGIFHNSPRLIGQPGGGIYEAP